MRLVLSSIVAVSVVLTSATPSFACYMVDSPYTGIERLQFHEPVPTVTPVNDPIVINRQVRTKSAPPTYASASPKVPAYGSPQAIAAQLVSAGQLSCFDSVISRESGWNVHATNPSSGAYGLPQALPGSKMATEGADWRYNPWTQLRWALKYMNTRWGSPCGAAAHEDRYGWY